MQSFVDYLMADNRTSGRFYDRHAASYDRRWRRYQRTTHDMLLTHLHGPFHQVLDVGCGTGTLLQRLTARYPETEGIGIDVSAKMLRQARRRLSGTDVRLYRADARWIPLPDHSVDLLTLTSALHYLPSPSIALIEARRVLKSGGTVGIVDYVPRAGAGSFLDGLIRLYDPGHVRCRGVQELSGLTARAGFTIGYARQFEIDRIFAGVIIIAQAPDPGPRSFERPPVLTTSALSLVSGSCLNLSPEQPIGEDEVTSGRHHPNQPPDQPPRSPKSAAAAL